VSKTRESPETAIDSLMERASRALIGRDYFAAERLCLEALEIAHKACDYERMARICLPLQEARRQKRDLAADAAARGAIFPVDDELPAPGTLRPGCYLVRPPRVGLDGRMLRELADRREVPVIVVVREPRTRAGLWPIVALGPVTIRAQVPPPPPPSPSASGSNSPAAARRGSKVRRVNAPARDPQPEAHSPADNDRILPRVEWFLDAAERLGDAALAGLNPARPVLGRVEDLLVRLAAHPDHEKLHQALEAACRDAARLPERERRLPPADADPDAIAPDHDDDEFGEGSGIADD